MSAAHRLPETQLEEAAFWAVRRAEGVLSAEEEARFLAWIEASPQNAEALEQIDIAWFSLADAANAPELLAMRCAALERARKRNRARWASALRRRPVRAFALAAAFLMAVLIGGYSLSLTPRSYETGIGERRVVALDDGSRISLDAATEVRVRYRGNRRELWLERGRAKFDVAHDPLQPFSVTAADRTVVATGTSFSVELVNAEMRVILYEGSVAVLDPPREGRPLPAVEDVRDVSETLTPGREFIASVGSGTLATFVSVDPMRSRAWEAGQVVFDDEPLAVAVARLNRYSSVRLVVGDATAADLRVNGVFNAGDTEAFLDGASIVLPVRVERRRDTVVISTDRDIFLNGAGVSSEP